MVNTTKCSVSQDIAHRSSYPVIQQSDYVTIQSPTDKELMPGTVFQMGMGFGRGTKYRMKDTDGGIVTSLDGFNSYLIVVDHATWFTWVFLSRYKNP
jgi:hypothetical protein